MSTVKVDTLVASDGTSPVTLTGQYAAKAWVNFNGTGTVAIRESGGVSSISDNGTGNYSVNLVTALTDANAAVIGTGVHDSGGYVTEPFVDNDNTPITTTRIRFDALQPNNLTNVDGAHLYISVIR